MQEQLTPEKERHPDAQGAVRKQSEQTTTNSAILPRFPRKPGASRRRYLAAARRRQAAELHRQAVVDADYDARHPRRALVRLSVWSKELGEARLVRCPITGAEHEAAVDPQLIACGNRVFIDHPAAEDPYLRGQDLADIREFYKLVSPETPAPPAPEGTTVHVLDAYHALRKTPVTVGDLYAELGRRGVRADQQEEMLGHALCSGWLFDLPGGRLITEEEIEQFDDDFLRELGIISKTRLKTDAERRNRPAPVWAVEGVLPEWGIGQIYGATYTGKTFVALDLALRIANGLPDWFGHKINRRGPVVYVLMEGSFDFQQRVDAWLAAHPGTTAKDLYTLEEEEVDLRDPASLKRIIEDVQALGLNPALVVIDTQGLATPGTDENSNTEMNQVMGLCKRLSRQLGAFVTTVHHTGYNTDRSRGASAQKQALDTEIRVREGMVKIEKVKAGRPSDSLGFELVESGDSVYVKPTSVIAALARANAGAGDEATAAKILQVVSNEQGINLTRLYRVVGGNRSVFDQALNALLGRQALEERPGPRNARQFFPAEDRDPDHPDHDPDQA